MAKPIFVISTVCLICTSLLCAWLVYPNADLRGKHQATLCNVLRLNPELKHQDQILVQMQFSYDNSTPSYAYHHPKFYRFYSQHLIQDFLKLSNTEQQDARHEYERCRQLLSPSR